MKTKFALLLLIAILCSISALCQRENDIWFFGGEMGLEFSSGIPLPISSNMECVEGPSSVCSPSGKLLFYSNGNNVWDKTNTIMPNGTGILGNQIGSTTEFWPCSCAQGTVIVPFIEDTNRYYLFVLDAFEAGTGYLRYSVIDMTLNGGLGDVVNTQKNIVLDSMLSEKMLVAPGAGCYLWLLVHTKKDTTYRAYKIDASGINIPVQSYANTHFGLTAYAFGEMKFSNDFKHLATIINNPNCLEINDFDNSTGIVSNARRIDEYLPTGYGVEFSPDGSKLYAGTRPGGLFQYDLSLLPSLVNVRASKYTVVKDTSINGFRTGPDNKLYVLYLWTTVNVARINKPNLKGGLCDFQPSLGFPLINTLYNTWSLGNNVQKPIRHSFISKRDTTVCLGTPLKLIARSNCDIFKWNNGSDSFIHYVIDEGKYWVMSKNDCDTYIDTIIVHAKRADSSFSYFDTSLCSLSSYTLFAPPGFSSYIWSDGVLGDQNVINGSTTKWVNSFDINCNVRVDTFEVQMINLPSIVKDTLLCANSTIILDATTPQVDLYQWQNGDTSALLSINVPGTYWVQKTKLPCIVTDTVHVKPRDFNVKLGENIIACEESKVTLNANINNAIYLWQDGSKEQQYLVKESGSYWVTVSSGNCFSSDSIKVEFVNCDKCIFIPNTFTPNNDQKNDQFKPLTFCPIKEYLFKIFNRYGEQVFSTADSKKSWDGNFNDKKETLAVYFYLVEVLFDYPGAKKEFYKGDITLIR